MNRDDYSSRYTCFGLMPQATTRTDSAVSSSKLSGTIVEIDLYREASLIFI